MANDSINDAPALLAPIARIYSRRLETYGNSAKGVLWQSEDGQTLRFEILARILEDEKMPVSVNDLGCGYGAFFQFLLELKNPAVMRYWGYDISEDMIASARKAYPDPRAVFHHSLVATQHADYSFASGTYNFKGNHSDDIWDDYIKASLKTLWAKSVKGMAFNVLDIKGSQPETGLYYADADNYVDFCRAEFSSDIELDREGVKDWTIFLRRV